jgi:hypothetical protein
LESSLRHGELDIEASELAVRTEARNARLRSAVDEEMPWSVCATASTATTFSWQQNLQSAGVLVHPRDD